MTVPEQLRQCREAQHLTIAQVAEITKLRADQVRALEEGRYGAFPAPVYVRGFVRTYCKLLKLDVAEVLAGLQQELGDNKPFHDPADVAPVGGILNRLTLYISRMDLRKSAFGAGFILLIAAVMGAYFVVRHYRTRDPLRDVRPALYEPARSNQGETLPVPAPKR